MIAPDLDDAYALFWDQLMFDANASGDTQSHVFFRMFGELAAHNGDCNDLSYAPARKEGRHGYQIDGYAFDAERGDLHLAIADLRPSRQIETLNASQIELLLHRAQRLCELALQANFVSSLEEASPTFEIAWTVADNWRHVKRVRLVLLSNAKLSTRRKPELAGEVSGVPFVCTVLDFSRYVEIAGAKGAVEPIEIDLTELRGVPLPCLPAHSVGGEYSSYLVVMPAELLAEIYMLYGARLLEQNVRTFLQARTKVNAGIIKTLEKSPDMFFAYNNGLTATAAGIRTQVTSDGALGITSITNLQIVNGGQTTASILYARDQKKADLSKAYVQMKLSVVSPAKLEETVPLISRFANTQNKVSDADFFSSHPLHLFLEQTSRRLTTPTPPGALSGSKWFYERARGQYRDRLAYGTTAERRRFEIEYPRGQLIEKTDLAKYETTFDCRPHVVSRGSQKCFLDFAEKVGKSFNDVTTLDDQFFKDVVAKAVVFRWTDAMIGRSDWYKENRGLKAQITTYAIAWIVHTLQSQQKKLNLNLIWQHQNMTDSLKIAITQIAPRVAGTLRATPPRFKNVGEYCKQQHCWSEVTASNYKWMGDLSDVSLHKEEGDVNEAAAEAPLDGLNFDRALIKLATDTDPVIQFARSHRMLTAKSEAALKRLTRGDIRLIAAERNALKHLLERMLQAGFDFGEQ